MDCIRSTPAPARIPVPRVATPAADPVLARASGDVFACSAASNPFTKVTRYQPDGAGHAIRQEGYYIHDNHVVRRDAAGQAWHAFATIDRSHSLRVVDGHGDVRLNLDYSATLGPAHADGWIRQMALDPDRKRLYVLSARALRAFDLDTGAEAGRLDGHGENDPGAIHVTRDGRLFCTALDGLRELSPELVEVRRIPLEGFTPSWIDELPGGDVVARGSLVLEDGRVRMGYDTHRAIVGRAGEVRLRDAIGDGAPGALGPDGSYWFPGKDRSTVRCYDPTTGACRDIALDTPAERILPRADGSFLTLHDLSGRLDMRVRDLDGNEIDRFRLEHPYGSLQHLVLSDDGRSAWAVVSRHDGASGQGQKDLLRFDLDRGLADRLWDRLGPGKAESSGTVVYSARTSYVPMVLADGRVLVCEPSGARLLDGDGQVEQTFASWREARSSLGSAFRPVRMKPLGDHAPQLDDDSADAWVQALERMLEDVEPHVAWMSPAPAGTPPTLPSTLATVEAGLERLWDPSHIEVTRFPVSTDLTMSADLDHVVVSRKDEPFTTVRTGGGGEKFTDAMAVDVGDMPYVVAGTSQGHVLLARADYAYGGQAAQVFGAGSPVTRVGLLDERHALAETATGAVMVLDLPLRPGETAVAGGPKGAPERGPQSPATPPPPPGIVEQPEDVIIGGVRIPRRTSS